MNGNEDAELMTVDEVAERLRVSSRTIRTGISAGSIESVRIGARVLVKRATVDAMIERGSTPGLKRMPITAHPRGTP